MSYFTNNKDTLFHAKPTLQQVIAAAKSNGYMKSFICSSCKKPSKRLITTKAEENVASCTDCSNSAQSGALRMRRKKSAADRV